MTIITTRFFSSSCFYVFFYFPPLYIFNNSLKLKYDKIPRNSITRYETSITSNTNIFPSKQTINTITYNKEIIEYANKHIKTETPHNAAEIHLRSRVQNRKKGTRRIKSHLAATERTSFRTHLPTSSTEELNSEPFRRTEIRSGNAK